MKKKLGEMLIEDGVITKDQLKHALDLQFEIRRREGTLIGGILVKLGYLDPDVLCQYLNRQGAINKNGREDTNVTGNNTDNPVQEI